MAIPDTFLEELVARSDLVDIVSGYVSLRRKGGRYWGCCPFHSEKTPSFSVNPDRQQYYCFGCHKGGGVINFIMEAENLPFRDAVHLLADKAGLTVPEDHHKGAGNAARNRKRLLELNRKAALFFYSNLYEPAQKPMLDYLIGRGLSQHTLKSFGLGAAPDSWDSLIKAMAEKGYDKAELLECGLAVKNERGRIYDRFRNRVVFPIIDIRGDVIGFGGRVLDNSTPKYLNSPDTPVFNKSKNLFALNIAKKSKQGRIILTEGYMDTIALHQAGFDCAVASLGTSLTEDHAQLISRYANEVVLSYDGDGAGLKAAQRAIGLLEKTGLDVKVLQITGAKDPDEYIRKFGAGAFSRLIEQSGNQVEFRLRRLQNEFDLTQDDGKVHYLQKAAELIAELPGPVEREVYAGRAAAVAQVSTAAFLQEVEYARKRRCSKQSKQERRSALNPTRNVQPKDRTLRYSNPKSARAEEGILRLLESDSGLFERLRGRVSSDMFSSPFLGRVYDLFRKRWQDGRSICSASLAGELSSEEMNQLAAIMQAPVTLQNSEQELEDYIQIIESERLRTSNKDDRDLLAFLDKKANGGTHL